MSVTVVGGNSPLSMLGMMLSGAGTVFGNPMLSKIGTGLSTAGAIASGRADMSVMDNLKNMLAGTMGNGWTNPATNNPATANNNYANWLKASGVS